MNIVVNIVIVCVGDKCNICFVMFCSNCLICVFFVKCDLIMVIGYCFIWGREGFKIKDMIGINVVKDDEIICGFYIWGFMLKCVIG